MASELKSRADTCIAYLKRLDQISCSVSFFSQLTGVDRRTAGQAITHLTPDFKLGTSDFYPFLPFLKKVLDQRKGMSGAEDWRAASAAKIDVERKILEGKYRPVEEIRQAGARLAQAFNSVLERDEFTPEQRETLALAMREALDKFSE